MYVCIYVYKIKKKNNALDKSLYLRIRTVGFTIYALNSWLYLFIFSVTFLIFRIFQESVDFHCVILPFELC
jgi:hypothetical protein